MFYQRRRLQVLLSILVIVLAVIYLGREFTKQSAPLIEGSPPSQISEALFLLRHSYVRPLEEVSLVRAAFVSLHDGSLERGLDATNVGPWFEQDGENLPQGPAAIQSLEVYLERIVAATHGKFPKEEAIYAAIDGMTKTLNDPYTIAMDPATFARFQAGLEGHAFGEVGIEIEWLKGTFLVFEVLDESPAAEGGVLPGDRLVGIDDLDLTIASSTAPSLDDVRLRLAGEPGSEVTLKFERAGAPYTRTLSRTVTSRHSVRGRVVADPEVPGVKLGWLEVQSLGETTGYEMVEALKALQSQKVDGIIIDLRNNVGGYLNAAVEAASIFLPSGQAVVQIDGPQGKRSKFTIGSSPYSGPLLVLVNQRTASSAELLTAALQDYKRADVLGSKTFGKGTVQTLHNFVDGGGFKITTARYLSPENRSIDGQGLTPDVPLDVGQSRNEHELRAEILNYCLNTWKIKASNS